MLDATLVYFEDVLGWSTKVFPHSPNLQANGRVIKGDGRMGGAMATVRGILGSDVVGMIGADVLDGVYSASPVLKRFRVLRLAHNMGKRTRIFGSSWSQTPAQEVIDALKAATWLDVSARDPISQERMQRDIDRPVRLVADLAFLMQPNLNSIAAHAAADWIKKNKAAGALTMGLNLSGHTIAKLPDQSFEPYVKLVSAWLDADKSRCAILLPHDVRLGWAGDVSLAHSLFDALNDKYGERIHLPSDALEAWEAKALVGLVDLTLTGRMHLAIASLGQGTPPLCVVYQGKFEGLMQHFNLEHEGLTMAPDEPLVNLNKALEKLERVTKERAALSAKILKNLPRVQELSRANFEGL